MKNEDLGSKKMNNKQNTTDLVSLNNENQSDSSLKSEIEVDKNGMKKVVERARITNHKEPEVLTYVDKRLSTKPSTAPEEIGKKMVENQDKNSDITAFRYPNSSPENHK